MIEYLTKSKIETDKDFLQRAFKFFEKNSVMYLDKFEAEKFLRYVEIFKLQRLHFSIEYDSTKEYCTISKFPSNNKKVLEPEINFSGLVCHTDTCIFHGLKHTCMKQFKYNECKLKTL